MVELRERLEELKIERKQEEERIRAENLQKRDEKLSSIQEKLNLIH
jgi:hypothetical protein